jgi:hypothetical protein
VEAPPSWWVLAGWVISITQPCAFLSALSHSPTHQPATHNGEHRASCRLAKSFSEQLITKSSFAIFTCGINLQLQAVFPRLRLKTNLYFTLTMCNTGKHFLLKINKNIITLSLE